MPDCNGFISSGIDSKLIYWDLKLGEIWNMKIFRSSGLSLSSDGKIAYIVSGSSGKIIKVDIDK